MMGQTARLLEFRPAPPSIRGILTEPRVAVLLNLNARRVTERVIRSIRHVVPEEDLFLSQSRLDERRIAQEVLDRRYPVVFCGGGDGTFMSFMNEVFRQLDQRNALHPQRPPRFGVLKLGTGNGLAALLSASGPQGDGLLDDLLRARTGEVPGYRRVDVLRVDGQRTMFAGMGIDAKVINDFNQVKGRWAKGAFKGLMSGSGGYFASVALMTLPHYLVNSTYTECEVINGRMAAYRLAADGSTVGEPLPPGAVLFRGRLNLAAAATVPYYGFELKAFPFAGLRRGMMHLRLCALTAAQTLTNLHRIWTGRWFPTSIHDFHVAEATVRFARPMPLQVAGDAEGYRGTVHLDIAPEQVELVDFTGTVN